MKRRLSWLSLLIAAVTAAILTSACQGPYKVEPLVDIAPNETAFLVPLEDTMDAQAQLQSVDYLNSKKVAAKRVTIPVRQRNTGRMWYDYEWIPTMRVIKVDRAPQIREWTKADDGGTTKANQAFKVESLESIDFAIGAVASASIHEEDAATFFYYFAGKPLTEVMDNNVRNKLAEVLFDEFGIRTLEAGQADKKKIFAFAEEQVKEHFRPLGITIDYIGGADGLNYSDPKVQQAINANYEAQQAKIRAQAQFEAQETLNKLAVDKAKAEADAKIQTGRGEAEFLRARGQALRENPQLIDLTVAEKWDGKRPQTEFNGSNGATPLLPLPSAPAPNGR